MFSNRSAIVVEDEALLRNLLVSLLETNGFRTFPAESAAEARSLSKIHDFDLAVIDIDLGAGPNGVDLSKVLLSAQPGIAILFLTNISDPRLLGIGPDQLPAEYGYLVKSQLKDPELLVSTIEKVLRNEVTPDIQQNLEESHPFKRLSNSQIEVLRLVATGYTATQIAERRGTTVRAVQRMVQRACDAAGIASNLSDSNTQVIVREFMRFSGIPNG